MAPPVEVSYTFLTEIGLSWGNINVDGNNWRIRLLSSDGDVIRVSFFLTSFTFSAQSTVISSRQHLKIVLILLVQLISV